MAYEFIPPQECLGDSLSKINNNAANFDTRIINLNTLVATISSLITAQYTAAVQEAVPAGAVHAFVQSSPPAGWISCEGVIVPNGSGTVATSFGNITANFTSLYAAVSNKFGSAGQLPDLRGYFIRGHGTNTDGTASTLSLGRKQVDALLNHNHTFSGTTGNDSPDHSHAYTASHATIRATFANNITDYSGGVFTNSTGGASTRHQHSFNGTTSNPSAGGDTETRPKNISLLYCIKY